MRLSSLSRRDILKLGAAAFVSSALPLHCFGAKALAKPAGTSFKPIRFAVLADLHVDVKGTNGAKMSAVSVECLNRTVADLNQEAELAFVLIAGDLLQDGELENAEVVKTSLDKLAMPYHVVAGNHDFVPADPKKRRDGFHYLSIDDFVQFFRGHGYDDSGQRHYAQQLMPGLRLIGLDSSLPLEPDKWGGLIPEKQLQWLDQELASHANEQHLLLVHHNLVRWSADEAIGGPSQWFCLDNDAEVRRVLAKHAGTAPIVISGHRHIGLRCAEIDGVNYFTMPSLNSHPMRHAVFTLSNNAIAWKTPMTSVAESVHVEARRNLLDATWWRATQFRQRSAANDEAVLQFYENNGMMLGSKKI